MIFRILKAMIFALLVSGCAAPIKSLPGRVVEATIVIEPGKLRLIDWAGAGRVATSEGIAYRPTPASSPKPTREEIDQANLILENNRRYTEYVRQPEVLRRAEAQAVPELERWLVTLAGEGFNTSRYRYPPLNRTGPELKLILYPDAALVSPKTFSERTSGEVLGDLATRSLVAVLAGGRAAGQQTLRYIGDFELVQARSGRRVNSGRLNVRFRYETGLNQSTPNAKFFSMMVWDAILRGATSGPAKTRKRAPAASTPSNTRVQKPKVREDAAALTAIKPADPQSAAPPVSGSPPLFEGTSYALFSPSQIAEYCAQSWRTRQTASGRTEYNPCTEKSAFAP